MSISLEAGKIIIRYRDGRAFDGIVLARYGNTMSVAVRGADDAVEFTCVHGTWVSEDCEPVEIRSDWQDCPAKSASEEDCICSKELAARLLQALFQPGEPQPDEDLNYEQLRYVPPIVRVV